jgi:branched-chain amino acid transport system permease protein
VFVIVSVGMNILVGYTGQISLGHAGFLAIGAYATVMTMTAWQLPFFLALPLAGLVAAAFGFILGLPALRLEGPYLTIATLGFGLAVIQVIGRSPAFGGHMGLAVPDMTLGPWSFSSDRAKYFVIILATILMTLAARNLMHSRIGRAFRAIRDSDIAAETLGVNLTYFKTLSFAVSAFYTGVAGGLMAFVLDFINPGQYTFVLSVLFLAMVVVGGRGSILGSVLGGVVVGYLNLRMDVIQDLPLIGQALEALSARFLTTAGLPNVGWVFMGLIMILAVAVEPLGLYGIWLRTKVYWKTWPF